MAQSLGTAIEQVAAVATPSPLSVAFPPGTAADSKAQQAHPPAAGVAADGPAARAPEAALHAVIDAVDAQLLSAGKSLYLSVDTLSGHSIVGVRDAQTGSLVQQIPSERLLRLAGNRGSNSRLPIDLTV